MDDSGVIDTIRAMRRLLPLLVITLISSHLSAQEVKKDDKDKKDEPAKEESKYKKDEKKDEKADKKSETEHSITLGGRKIDYTATAGTLALKDAEGKTTADIF